MSTGIRELKDNLRRNIRRIDAGERIAVTAHGRIIAELVPPGAAGRRFPVEPIRTPDAVHLATAELLGE
jgi:antitoxin (DNA-binding transcriptional repressor) of toxin-antitoxin stability system